MRVITHRHRIAALAAERVYYASHIEILEPDHPERRFVAALCLYSHAVDTGRAGRPYDQGEAEAFARALLMPDEAVGPVIAWSDPELACGGRSRWLQTGYCLAVGRPDWYTDEMAVEDSIAAEKSWYRVPARVDDVHAAQIRSMLESNGVTYVCHVTLAKYLPQIATDGGLLSGYAISYLRGEHVKSSGHGNRDREGWSRAFVYYGFWPAWYLCRRHDEQLAIILIRAEAVCLQKGALFAPDQFSARTVNEQQSWSDSDRVAALESCFAVGEPHKKAEIAAGRTIVSDFQAVIFPDDASCEYWWPRFVGRCEPRATGERVQTAIHEYSRFAFPPD